MLPDYALTRRDFHIVAGALGVALRVEAVGVKPVIVANIDEANTAIDTMIADDEARIANMPSIPGMFY